MIASAIEGLLIDLDGVLYVEEDAVPGAVAAVSKLREQGLGLRFVTNTTSRSKRQTLERLERLGFEVEPGELVTPAALARARCLEAGHDRVALVMNEQVKEDFEGLTEASDDAGPFVAAIEYATGEEALVVGKPAQAFFELVLDDLGLAPSAAGMVGDDVETDVGGAIGAGLAGILVRTGKYREDFVAQSGVEPTAVADSIADVPGLLIDD